MTSLGTWVKEIVADRHRRVADGGPSCDRMWPRLERLLAARPYSSVIMVVNPDMAGRRTGRGRLCSRSAIRGATAAKKAE